MWILWIFLILLGILFLYNILQRKYPILHNYPIIAQFRFILIKIGPQLRQYIIADDREELPFSRNERDWIQRSAQGQDNYFGFGTDELIYGLGYPIIRNAAIPYGNTPFTASDKDKPLNIPCLKVMGLFHQRRRPYQPSSIINISAMSFGSLGANAIKSLCLGAKEADCYVNTGEGGLAPYHVVSNADIVFQIGTGYFGCRNEEGGFSLERLVSLCEKYPQIRAIEIKLSQGAKPGKGGVLPAAKVTEEIAAIRGIKAYVDCISPNHHKEFRTPIELLDFVNRIADATGLPVGIKAAIGKTDFYESLAVEMKRTGKGIDFFSIDGGEGGTGAAPLTFADHVSLPFKLGFMRIYQIFQKHQLCERVVFIGAGKLGFPDRATVALALGCDLLNVAREAMIATGCIQAKKCHTGFCPTGIATHNKWLQAGLHPEVAGPQLAKFIRMFRNEIAALGHAAGYDHPAKFTMDDIEISAGVNVFKTLGELYGYNKEPVSENKLI
jgi:glutamate synthase (ferredoxin)